MNPYDPLTPAEQAALNRCNTNSSPRHLPFSNISDDDVECETNARRKLKEWGFDPDDVSKSSSDWYSSPLLFSSNIHYCQRFSRPMIIFAHLGDLPMMRYILKESNDPAGELSKSDEYGLFPLYAAISKPPPPGEDCEEYHNEDHVLAVCRWLHANGCDVKQTVGNDKENGWSPLSRACLFGFQKVAIWLLSSGALLDHDVPRVPSFDVNLAKRDLPSCGYEPGEPPSLTDRIHQKIFAWSKELVSTRNNYFLFLSGTLVQPTRRRTAPLANNNNNNSRQIIVQRMVSSRGCCGGYSEAAISFLLQDIPDSKLDVFLNTMTASPLVIFNGHSGILEHIAQYVGVVTDKAILCTARGLVEHQKWWNLFLESSDVCFSSSFDGDDDDDQEEESTEMTCTNR